MAIVKRHKDVAELLILKGADVNAVTKYGLTPLDMAHFAQQKDVRELLIRKGAQE